jgi:hypothetical protein
MNDAAGELLDRSSMSARDRSTGARCCAFSAMRNGGREAQGRDQAVRFAGRFLILSA